VHHMSAHHQRTSCITHLAKRIVSHTHTHTEERQPTPAANSRTQMATAMTAGGATAAACTTGLQQVGRTCINGMHSSSASPRSSSSLSSNFLCTMVTILTEFLVVFFVRFCSFLISKVWIGWSNNCCVATGELCNLSVVEVTDEIDTESAYKSFVMDLMNAQASRASLVCVRARVRRVQRATRLAKQNCYFGCNCLE
jgi:hypothetical protein